MAQIFWQTAVYVHLFRFPRVIHNRTTIVNIIDTVIGSNKLFFTSYIEYVNMIGF